MELIDKNKITFEPIEIYNIDESKHEITGMALFKDVEKIPIIKAIPLDKIKQVRKEIKYLRLHKVQFITSDAKVCIDSLAVLEIIDKLIEEYEREE